MVRFFSIKRIALSCALGFLVPLGYAFLLSLGSDYTGRRAPEVLIMPFGWPLSLWDFLIGRRPSEGDLIGRLIFLVLGNILAYGAIIYGGLTMLVVLRRKRSEHEPPPPPGLHSA